MLSKSAENMERVCRAKEQHNRECPWGGTANAVHLSWFDLERLGWEAGDVICGLVVVGDETITTGRMRVVCDAEGDTLPGVEEDEEVDVVVAVADQRQLISLN